MKLSKYNLIVKDNGKYLVYNYFTTSFVVFDENTYQSIINKHETNIDDLVKARILVDDAIDEDKLFLQYCEDGRRKTENLFNEIVIFTTTTCNAQCYYCYEHRLQPMTMNKMTARNVVNFIIKNYRKYNNDNICLRWFGGEPLVNHEIISFICNELNKEQIVYESKMITNGLLFDKELVIKAKELWNLKRLQITLDSIGEQYNAIKNYKGNYENAFSKIIDNILLLLNAGIKVSIRVNYKVNNVEEALKIIEYLSQYNYYKNLTVYSAAIREIDSPPISSFSNENSPHLKILQHLKKFGFLQNINILLPRIKFFPCEAWMPKRYFIYPNGDIYKCQHTISDNDYAPLGNVANDHIDESVSKLWVFRGLPNKCFNCNVSMLCQGGCKSIQDNGEIKDVDCYRYKNSIDGLIRLYYKFYKEEHANGNS